ncbi:MAG: hypothetical protein H7X93_12535, partial [Sphingomonadaceae bacterium]|nr:hypothetical protein [Sphingomonadaceae bacterium]
MKTVLIRIAASTLAIGVTTAGMGAVAFAAEEGDPAAAEAEASGEAARAAASARE